MSELGKRVITGAIGGAALVLILVFGGWLGTYLLTVLFALMMLYEYGKITLTLPDATEKRYALLLTGWFVLLANLLSPGSEYPILVISFLGTFIYYLFTAHRHEGPAFVTHFRELLLGFFGTMYLPMLWLYLPKIHESTNGVHWTLIFLLIVWSGDTGAYFAGKKYGKTKLYPKISPKKTREGGLGGLLAGLVIAFLYKVTLFHELSWGGVFVTPILVGTVAAVGDLCESFIKRAYDTKDSGAILPGHGGFLDRFDGVVFSLPVMYACIRVFS